MENKNNQLLDNQIDSNDISHSQKQYLGNISSNNDSAEFHVFEHLSFNMTKLEEEFGEIKKKFYTSKSNFSIIFIYRLE